MEAAPPVALAAVGSVSGPYWQIQAIPSPSSSPNSRWRRSQIIWRLKDLSRRPSGESEWLDGKGGVESGYIFFVFLPLPDSDDGHVANNL